MSGPNPTLWSMAITAAVFSVVIAVDACTSPDDADRYLTAHGYYEIHLGPDDHSRCQGEGKQFSAYNELGTRVSGVVCFGTYIIED